MKINAILIDPKDTVVTVIEGIEKGAVVQYHNGRELETITAIEPIPIYHKIAIKEMSREAVVYKYGQPIATATCDIHVGQHVHEHNVTSKSTIE